LRLWAATYAGCGRPSEAAVLAGQRAVKTKVSVTHMELLTTRTPEKHDVYLLPSCVMERSAAIDRPRMVTRLVNETLQLAIIYREDDTNPFLRRLLEIW
jgi:hypothetical protein